MRIFLIKIFFIVSSLSLAQVGYAANMVTSFKFSTLETEHFSIHFHQGLEEVAQKTAGFAEEIHHILVKEFRWTPQEKTQVILMDNSDFANGAATVFPYNTVYLKIVPPSIDMMIGEYEDWLKMLFIHEYTHILTLDTGSDFSVAIRRIFGKSQEPGDNFFSLLIFFFTVPRNYYSLPPWWQEGIATWAETEYTNMGRGRSTYYEMILRLAALENNIPGIDQINGDVPFWPGGNHRYIFGMYLQKYIADKYGQTMLGSLNLNHAESFPYFLNQVPEEIFNRNYIRRYREMTAEIKIFQKIQIEILKQAELTPLKTLKLKGELLTNPRYSPDGKLVAVNKRDPHGHQTITVIDKNNTEVKQEVNRNMSDLQISWSADSRKIYFCQAEINQGFNIYQDLYVYDLKQEKLQRLTKGQRVKEAELSPDGKTFVAVKSDRGSQNLVLLETEEKNNLRVKVLTDYKYFRVANPRWSPDGKKIVFEVKDNTGKNSLNFYDLKENRTVPILEKNYNLIYPVWSKDGRYIIYSSDQTGVYNLFAYFFEEEKSAQISHVLGGVFQADISPDNKEIIFSNYSSRGFKIVTIDNDPEKRMKENSPALKTYWKESGTKFKTPEITTGEKNISPQTYSPLPTLVPRFWLPSILPDANGGVSTGILTAGQDVLKYNTYRLELVYGLNSRNKYYDILYLNDYFYPTYIINANKKPVIYSDLLNLEEYDELKQNVFLGMTVPLNYLEAKYNFTLGINWQKQEAMKYTKDLPQLFHGQRNNVLASVDFFNTLKYPYSISHEQGRKINLTTRYYSQTINSEIEAGEYIVSYSEYLKIQAHQVLYFNFKAGVSGGESIAQEAFQLGGYDPELEFPLRGYPSRFKRGPYVATATLEYRFPMYNILQGWNTKPFFWERIHGAIIADTGEVWNKRENFVWDELKTGAGIELRFDWILGYQLKLTPTLGVTEGFNSGGGRQYYFAVHTNL